MILVTGATGTIGSEVVRLLCAQGVDTRALVRSPERADSLRGYDCSVAVGDFADPQSLEAALRGVDAVFLSVPLSAELPGTELAVARSAARAGGRRLVTVVPFDYDDPAAGRGSRAHARALADLSDAGLQVDVVASAELMQNLVRAAGAVQERSELPLPWGSAGVAAVDAADVAAVVGTLLTGAGGTATVRRATGPAAVTGGQVADVLAGLLGRPVRHVDPDDAEIRRSHLEEGASEWAAEARVEEVARLRSGAGAATSTDVVEATGRRPRDVGSFLAHHRAIFS